MSCFLSELNIPVSHCCPLPLPLSDSAAAAAAATTAAAATCVCLLPVRRLVKASVIEALASAEWDAEQAAKPAVDDSKEMEVVMGGAWTA